jgi:hypothetical protein
MQEQVKVTLATRDWQAESEQVCTLALAGQWQQAEQLMHLHMMAAMDASLAEALDRVLGEPTFRARLRRLGGTLGLRCRGDHPITVILPGGTRHQVLSPYFVKAQPQGRRKRKRGPGQQRGRHLALDLFGFMAETSPTLAFRALALSALCPSFATASAVLAGEGIGLSADKLRALAARFDDLPAERRVAWSSAEGETLAGKRVLIAVDGGRCREREAKPGRLPKGRKRRGFTTEWREPKLFTLAVLDDAGELDRAFPVQADATLTGLDGLLTLLRAYLVKLDLAKAREVILVGDGAKWLWHHLPALLADLGLPADRLHQVLDHTHARQNLHELLAQLRPLPTWNDAQQTRQRELLDLLWHGRIRELADRLQAEAAPGGKRAVARKAREYFLDNAHRLQYARFKAAAIPRGSGIVESAIRRIVNLRVKSAGSFWLRAKAETMIFLRAKLLYGRWHHLVHAWQRDLKVAFTALAPHHDAQPPTVSLEKVAA